MKKKLSVYEGFMRVMGNGIPPAAYVVAACAAENGLYNTATVHEVRMLCAAAEKIEQLAKTTDNRCPSLYDCLTAIIKLDYPGWAEAVDRINNGTYGMADLTDIVRHAHNEKRGTK